MFGLELVGMISSVQCEIALAEASDRRFEENLEGLPVEKQKELRALRQIANEAARNSKPERVEPPARGPGGFLMGMLLGNFL